MSELFVVATRDAMSDTPEARAARVTSQGSPRTFPTTSDAPAKSVGDAGSDDTADVVTLSMPSRLAARSLASTEHAGRAAAAEEEGEEEGDPPDESRAYSSKTSHAPATMFIASSGEPASLASSARASSEAAVSVAAASDAMVGQVTTTSVSTNAETAPRESIACTAKTTLDPSDDNPPNGNVPLYVDLGLKS